MRVHRVQIKNFRLLANVELVLEDQTTVVVGRNNSGKTSLSEIMRRFLSESNPKFQIEDFSSASYDGFCDALNAKRNGLGDDEVRALIPSIELKIFFRYDPAQPELGPLSDFVIDLDPACTDALVIIRYELADGAIDALFEGQVAEELTAETRVGFFRILRERIPSLFTSKVWAQDPNDPTNKQQKSQGTLHLLLATNFVNAQRGLDDTTSRETDVLAKILEGLFTTAMSPTASADDRVIADALTDAVQGIQQKIDEDFNLKLRTLLPTLKTFGYPGLGGSELETETTLDVKKLLTNHTKVRYAGYSGVHLPESYNGLGVRNLIFILLQLVRFYKVFRAEANAPRLHLIFIEEPEAHLHPQMQEVFIRQLSKLANQLNGEHPEESPWPVQFVVSTHSSHIANEAGFEAIRYFLATSAEAMGVRQTKIKDLREGLREMPQEYKSFLHQYLTLTRCDLFFADKAALVEGTSERLLLPVMIRKFEQAEPDKPKLSSQYMTVMEVGGAYAHIFFELLEFLELRCLIVTDLDSVSVAGGTACPVHQGTATSNACLKAWFNSDGCSLADLMAKTETEKLKNRKRIAFQRPEVHGGPCGRTLEDAFMLTNEALFRITGSTSNEKELKAWELLGKIKKSEFALKYAIGETSWSTPGYILDGIKWLAEGDIPIHDSRLGMIVEAIASPGSVEGGPSA
ncbi:MAG: ATP-dependent endonuclease [Nitrospira sp.]|nr:ATP-dependent endonuclease [Nitrospira sp.]